MHYCFTDNVEIITSLIAKCERRLLQKLFPAYFVVNLYGRKIALSIVAHGASANMYTLLTPSLQ